MKSTALEIALGIQVCLSIDPDTSIDTQHDTILVKTDINVVEQWTETMCSYMEELGWAEDKENGGWYHFV